MRSTFVLGVDATAMVRSEPTGVDRYATGLVQAVADLQPSWELQLATWRASRRHRRPDIVTAGRASWRASRVPREAYRLAELAGLSIPFDRATRVRADAWLFPDFVALPLSTTARSVVVVHDISYLGDQRFTADMHRAYLARNVRRSVEAGRVATVSAFVARQLTATYGLAPEQVLVAPPGIDRRLFRPPTAEQVQAVRASLALDRPYVLAVGALHARKNLVRLMAAFRGLGAAAATMDLVLAGSVNAHSAEVLAAVAEYSGPGRVRHIGYVDDTQLAGLYGGATVTAQVSTYEGYGLPVVEAMACGSPVVASDTGALPEAGGAAALYVDPGDTAAIAAALARCIDDPGLRARLARQGIARARECTWEDAARRVTEALAE